MILDDLVTHGIIYDDTDPKHASKLGCSVYHTLPLGGDMTPPKAYTVEYITELGQFKKS